VLQELIVGRVQEALHAAGRKVDARDDVGERRRLRKATQEVQAGEEDLCSVTCSESALRVPRGAVQAQPQVMRTFWSRSSLRYLGSMSGSSQTLPLRMPTVPVLNGLRMVEAIVK